MRYLPWDRLQISTDIHNHAPVRKAEIVYPLYKGFHSTFAHIPHYHRNLGIYTEHVHEREEVLKNFAQDNDPVQKFATVALFDPSGMLQSTGEALEAAKTGFEYHEYHADFETLLGDLLSLRDQIRLETQAAGMAQSYHRRVYTVIINIDNVMSRELRSIPKIQAGLQELLLNSADENFNIVMLAGNVFIYERKFLELFDQDAYLGEENMHFALEFYEELDEGNISMMQHHVGWGRRRNSARLTSLHPRKYTPSQWMQERQEAIAAEEEAYAKFLASLSVD